MNETVTEETVNTGAGMDEQLKAEYLKYISEIKEGRYTVDNSIDAIKHIDAICKVLALTTVVPKVERRSSKGEDGRPQHQDVIIGGTNIDLVKSQYPGVYPILMERLLELTVKL